MDSSNNVQPKRFCVKRKAGRNPKNADAIILMCFEVHCVLRASFAVLNNVFRKSILPVATMAFCDRLKVP